MSNNDTTTVMNYLRLNDTTRLRNSTNLILALIAVLISVVIGPPPLAAQGDTVVRIIGADLSQFPTVTATVSYSTRRGEPVSPLPAPLVDLNGVAITDVVAETQTRPLAVSIVVDLSARMSDRGTPIGRRFDDMRPLLQDLVDQLVGAQHTASLISFDTDVNLLHPLTGDLGAVRNTLASGDADRAFDPAPLDGGDPSDPYPLVDALRAGLDQLAGAEAGQSLALVLFAAGDPRPQDLDALRAAVDAYRDQKRPIRVLVVSFGDDAAGSFTTLPADPNSLQQVAAALGGSFFPVGTDPLGVALRRDIDGAYAGLLKRAEVLLLRFVAENVPAGQADLRVSIDGSADAVPLALTDIPPRFNVVVDTRNFQDRVRLSIDIKFAQASIANVEYLLDNRLITQPITDGPNFILELDAYDPTFQQRFPPGEYVLNAVATDAGGNKSSSESSLTVTVFAPPPEAQGSPLLLWAGGALAAVAIGGGLAFFLGRGRMRAASPIKAPRQTDPILAPPPPRVDDDWITGAIGGATAESEDKPTAELPSASADEDKPTAELPHLASRRGRWFLEVIDGDDLILPDGSAARRVELRGSFVDIGRAGANQIRVAKRYEAISRRHVTLELFLDTDYIGLRDHTSSHGTFIDDTRSAVAQGALTRLKSGQTFSLAGLIKLRVELEQS